MKVEIEIVSKEVISYLDRHELEGSPYDSEINRLLEIGVAVVERVEVNRDVEFVKKEVEKMTSQFNNSLGMLFADVENKVTDFIDGSFDVNEKDSHIAKFAEYLRNGLKEFKTETVSTTKLMLDNAKEVSTDKIGEVKVALDVTKDSIVKFQNALNEQTDFSRVDSFPVKLLKETEKYFGKESPIINVVHNIVSDFSGSINSEIIKLREEIARKSGEVEMLEKTAVKGFLFEEQVNIKLSDIAKNYSDIVTSVGAEKEKGNSKRGDFIYQFNEGEKIVIECKDSVIGLKPMIDYMNSALENRGCNFGILLTKTVEQLPNQVGVFNLYENKLFCCFEYLEFAIRWVRLYLNRIKSSEGKEEINSVMIKDKINNIVTELKNLSNVKKKLTGISNFVAVENNGVVELLDKMKASINDQLTQLENEID